MKTDKLKCTVTERWDLMFSALDSGHRTWRDDSWGLCSLSNGTVGFGDTQPSLSLCCALEIKSLYKRVEGGGSEVPRWILLIL